MPPAGAAGRRGAGRRNRWRHILGAGNARVAPAARRDPGRCRPWPSYGRARLRTATSPPASVLRAWRIRARPSQMTIAEMRSLGRRPGRTGSRGAGGPSSPRRGAIPRMPGCSRKSGPELTPASYLSWPGGRCGTRPGCSVTTRARCRPPPPRPATAGAAAARRLGPGRQTVNRAGGRPSAVPARISGRPGVRARLLRRYQPTSVPLPGPDHRNRVTRPALLREAIGFEITRTRPAGADPESRQVSVEGRSSATGCARPAPCHPEKDSPRARQRRRRRQLRGSDRSRSWYPAPR